MSHACRALQNGAPVNGYPKLRHDLLSLPYVVMSIILNVAYRNRQLRRETRWDSFSSTLEHLVSKLTIPVNGSIPQPTHEVGYRSVVLMIESSEMWCVCDLDLITFLSGCRRSVPTQCLLRFEIVNCAKHATPSVRVNAWQRSTTAFFRWYIPNFVWE